MKYIIDMDIGDDIDDALALYFAMRLDIDIVGITTVFGNTEKRARIAKKMLKTQKMPNISSVAMENLRRA